MKMHSKEEILAAKKDDALKMIRENMDNNDNWVTRTIVRIYTDNQTTDEQMTQTTTEDNGIGFSGVDANILSSFALQILENERTKKYRSPLSPKQMAIARKKAKKYARQVYEFIK